MDYPLFLVPYIGGSWLIGGNAILHVIIAHFAIGGGILLAVTEQRAARRGAAALLLTILGMVMLRDAVRDLYLQSIVKPEALPVQTQLDLILRFVNVLLVGLATLAWIGRRLRVHGN